MDVPEVLRSGDHGRIAAWRREQSLRKTARVRPDLLAGLSLSQAERAIVDDELNRAHVPKEG
jgi:tRNA (guanine37-N1)-methyltransferase